MWKGGSMNRGMGKLKVLSDIVAIVLAGGQGERLYPLTRDRAKPAVPFGANYRLIDFTLSNCLNSGVRRVHVLTQYKSDSLYRHIRLGWDLFNVELDEYIEVNPPQLRLTSHWYLGTADAIYQNIYTLERERPSHVLVLSGDHIYKMDYMPMVIQHLATGADVTIACVPAPLSEAKRLGVVSVDEDDRALDFTEKPPQPHAIAGCADKAFCSMGVYIFQTETLVRRVVEDSKRASSHDFGRDVIPTMIGTGDKVLAFRFTRGTDDHDPYWRDIGTIDAYWQANMDLLHYPPILDLHGPDWPIRSHEPSGPPTMMAVGHGPEGAQSAEVCNSLIAAGSVIRGARVYNSIIGRGVHIGEGTRVHESVIMDRVHIGRDAAIRTAIVDKGNAIPDHFQIGVDREEDGRHFSISDNGIVVVPKEMPLFRQ